MSDKHPIKAAHVRRTGIEIIGDVPWGTHFCQFYETKQDLIDILVPYFKAGLESNEFCMWVTAEPLGVEEATRALREAVPDLDRRISAGQIEIIPHTDWYLKGGSFEQDRVLNGWVEKLNGALARGFEGLRLTGNTFWLEKDDWQSFTDYEEAVNNVIGGYRMLAICTYSTEKCRAGEIADVVANHEFALMKRAGEWTMIESSTVRQTKQALQDALNELDVRAVELEAMNAEMAASNEELVNTNDELNTEMAERKRAEDELRESRGRFRSLFDNMSEGFALHEIICDETGKPIDYLFLEMNAAFERLTGLKREDVIGRTVYEVLPGTEPSWVETYGKVALTGKPVSFENRHTDLGKWYRVYAFRPAKGQFAVLFLDITESKKAEEELARLASFPQRNPEPIVEVDAEGCVHYMNPAAEKLFSDLKEKGWNHPWLSGLETVMDSFREGGKRQAERDVPMECLCYRQMISYVEEADRVRVYGIDITERRQVEEALRESEERYRSLFDSLLEGFCIIEVVFDTNNKPVDYRFLVINPAFEEQTGLHNAQGRLMRELAPDHEAHWFQVYGKVALTGEPARFVNEAKALNRWYDVSAYRIGGEQSRRVGILFSDITERKRAELALQDAFRELDVRAEELEAMNEEIAASNEELVTANEDLAEARADAERRAAQLESVLSSMADGVVLLDANGRAVMMNDAGKALLGIPAGESWDDMSRYERLTLDGRPIPIEDAAAFRALRGETAPRMRYRVISPWGKDIILDALASPVRDNEGKIIGAVNVLRDVSDEVELERRQRELFEREHRIAEVLQEALIPSQHPYAVGRVSIATKYQPALQEAQIGGDFYDIFELGDGKIGVVIGDVAGKGLQAAIRVAAARHSIRSYAYLDLSPGKVMASANEALVRSDMETISALTAFFAVVDTACGVMAFASAGHPAPMVCKTDNTMEELQAAGVMLGVISGQPYAEGTYELHSGDKVVMFTDGITEARHHGSVLFDKEGVMEHLTKVCDATPEDIADALLNAATAHAGGSLQDDAAIVVLGYSSEEQG